MVGSNKYKLIISSSDSYKSLFLGYILLFFFGWFGLHNIYIFWDSEIVTWELYFIISIFSIVLYLIWTTFTTSVYSGVPLVILGSSIFALILLVIFLISDAITLPRTIRKYNLIVKDKKDGSSDFINQKYIDVLEPTGF